MKRNIKSKLVLLLTFSFLTFNTIVSSQTTTDWSGTYRGVLPCASCEGIQTELTLNKNKTYDLITRQIGKGDMGVRAISNSFTWNKEGTTIILGGIKKEIQPTQYLVGEKYAYTT
jgi:uncharacterized lipoprotein NlpE involved in copper resistance